MRGALLWLVLFAGAPLWAADELAEFTTDGCSLFPDGSPVNRTLWCDCCVAHDMAYWRGGTEAERKQADEELRACVAQRTNTAFAELVYAGVRAGGVPVFPTWYRWGYGWRYGRGYQPLSETEASLAEERLQNYRLAHHVLSCEPEQPIKETGQTADGATGTREPQPPAAPIIP